MSLVGVSMYDTIKHKLKTHWSECEKRNEGPAHKGKRNLQCTNDQSILANTGADDSYSELEDTR